MGADYDLWLSPDGKLVAAIELVSFIDIERGVFGAPQLYLLQGKKFIKNYADWSFWCTIES